MSVNVDRTGGPMPDSAREGRWSLFSHWETLSDEVVRYNIYVGTNIAEYGGKS
jgi:hypothetical protein